MLTDLKNYLDAYTFVNKEEIYNAVNDYFIEEWDLKTPDWTVNQDLADEYIKEKNLKFDSDLVITLDRKNKKIHLEDLNNELNEKQVQRLEKQYQNVFLNACDCLYYGYWKNACNFLWLDEEAKAKIRDCAKNYMSEF